MEELWDIKYKWRYLGRALKLSQVLMDTIEDEYDYTRDHFREVLKHWLKLAEPRPTWQALIDALREIGEPELAEHIRCSYTLGECGG